MGAYRYVGGAGGQILDTPFVFKRYGQLVEMEDKLATQVMAAGFHILPESEFKESGHTEDELKQWGSKIGHHRIPPAVAAKRDVMWARVSERQMAASAAINKAIADSGIEEPPPAQAETDTRVEAEN